MLKFMRKNKKMLFRNKLFAAFILITVIPIFIMGSFTHNKFYQIINSRVKTSINDSIGVTTRLIDESVGSFINFSSFISTNDEIKSILSKKEYKDYNERLNDVQTINKITDCLFVNSNNCVPIYIIGTQNKYSKFTSIDYIDPYYLNFNNDIFKKINDSNDEPVLYPKRRTAGKDKGDVVLEVGMKIRTLLESKDIGYVFVDIYDDYFNDIFKNIKVYKEANIFVLDNDGTIITDKLYKNRTGFKFYNVCLDKILKNKNGDFLCSINNVEYNIRFDTCENTGLKVVFLIPQYVIYKDSSLIIKFVYILIIVMSIIAIIVSYILSKSISEPIKTLSGLMNKVKTGDRNVRFNLNCNDEIGDLGNSFNDMIDEINKLIKEVYLRQCLLKKAEFNELKAQMNPHFLYNILESINWMAKMGDCANISTMITTLGKFLRYSLNTKSDIVTVRECMNQINNYLRLQKMRYGDKFEIKIDIEEDIYDKKMLKFLIQPLVENAIIHGLEPKRGKGNLIIKGFKENDDICFEIIDDGIGMGNDKSAGEGIGMKNVNDRIKIHYGDKYGLCCESNNRLTCVKIIIPESDN